MRLARQRPTMRDSIASQASSANAHPGSWDRYGCQVSKATLRVRQYSDRASQSCNRCTCSTRQCSSTLRARSPRTVPATPPSQVNRRTSCPMTNNAGR